VQIQFVLTVAECKRLIAKGVAEYDPVTQALQKGTVALAKGSTNSYIYEELTGEKISRPDYMTGKTMPASEANRLKKAEFSSSIPDLVLTDGKPVEGRSATEALADMGEGDVFIKGANAVNYRLQQAALLIGHPTGGTWGAAVGTCVARRIRMLIPVGLEKDISTDLVAAAHAVNGDDERVGQKPALWPMTGDIFTEIEAFDVLADVEAIPIAAGGLGGAEGAMRFLVMGEPESVERAREIVDSVLGEPPFVG